ncbi:RNA polymerase sigma factor [Pedobacter deserti]|uniref:RNA polymerase sigma factor n=1 Tax=Pedobacter deserti TaxID=2817382 RepID=UPI00210E2C66|nr:sigma-70 family RNA polymerase sigma factor [Pedobacter sp. SYSU D00382]
MGSVNEFDEQNLLIRLKNGDEHAFAVLYDAYKYRLTGNLFKLLKSSDLVKETLQEIFVRVWENRERIEPDKSFKSYIFRIGENLVSDYYRKVARDRRLLNKMMEATSELYLHIEEDIWEREGSQKFMDAIALMPPQRKQVFTLCKLEGKSYKEVEEILGISAKTISSHMLQANRFLRNHFRNSSGLELSIILAILVKGL